MSIATGVLAHTGIMRERSELYEIFDRPAPHIARTGLHPPSATQFSSIKSVSFCLYPRHSL